MSGSSQDEAFRALNQSMMDASFSSHANAEPSDPAHLQRTMSTSTDATKSGSSLSSSKSNREAEEFETEDEPRKRKKMKSARDSFNSRRAKHAHFLNSSCWQNAALNPDPSSRKGHHGHDSDETRSDRSDRPRQQPGHSFDSLLFRNLLFPSLDSNSVTADAAGSMNQTNASARSRHGNQASLPKSFLNRRPSMISSYDADIKYTFYHNDCRLIQGQSWAELEERLSSLALAKSLLSRDSSEMKMETREGEGEREREKNEEEQESLSTCSSMIESETLGLWILKLMSKGVFWLDIQDPSGSELRALGSIFNLHPLTLEDILEGSCREKCKVFHERSYVYFCLNSPVASQSMQTGDLQETKSTNCIVHSMNVLYFILFRDGVLTLHLSPSLHPSLPLVLERVGRSQRGLVSSEWILYATLDMMADFLFPLVKGLEREADQIDFFVNQDYQNAFSASSTSLHPDPGSPQANTASVPIQETKRAGWDTFSSTSSEVIDRIAKARMNLTSLSRALRPRISSLRVFLKRQGWLSSATRFYFQDLEETLGSLNNSLEYVSEDLGRSYGNHLVHLNIHLSVASFATNTTVKRLTVAAGIFLPLTLIANIFGMSVAVPGEQGTDWSQYTEWFVIVGILILLTVLFVWISKRLQLI